MNEWHHALDADGSQIALKMAKLAPKMAKDSSQIAPKMANIEEGRVEQKISD